MTAPLRIGLSANFMHADPDRALYRSKTLVYSEERMMRGVANAGALPLMLPPIGDLDAHLDLVDGVLLTGGADVAPQSYNADPIEDGAWLGDPVRDAFEIDLLRRSLQRGLPLLAICRGVQVLNVALGGTLLQDIRTQRPDANTHRDWHQYDELEHPVAVAKGSLLADLYPGQETLLVNSIHHQALDRVADDLVVTAVSPDKIIEAVEMPSAPGFVLGVQWHPEWLDHAPEASARCSGAPIFAAFMDAAAAART